MNWELAQWIGGFILAALGSYYAYKRLNFERKDSMASTIQKLAESSESMAERIGKLETDGREKDERIETLEKDNRLMHTELEQVKRENTTLKNDNKHLKKRVDRLVEQLQKLGQEPADE